MFTFLSQSAFAAFSANAVWEIRQNATANNANGCAFVTGASGTDYSQQAAAQYSITGATSAGTGAVILTASAAADQVGNFANISAGTNFNVGWYEITAATPGVSITVDHNSTTGVGAAGVLKIGGACSLGNAAGTFSDDALFESPVSGNIMYIAGTGFGTGSYTLGTTVSIANNATAANPIRVIGYGSVRGDNPTAGTRPTITGGAGLTTILGNNWDWAYTIYLGNGVNNFTVGSGGKIVGNKFVNSSTTVSRNALTSNNANTYIFGNEMVSYRGIGLLTAASTEIDVENNYFHDSNICVSDPGSGSSHIYTGNIFEGCQATALKFTGSLTNTTIVDNNTFYGAENKLGVGLDVPTGVTFIRTVGNIFYGLVTGAQHADSGQNGSLSMCSNYFNNTTNRTNWNAGPGDLTLDPQFFKQSQITGSTATTSGSVLTQTGANFPTFTPSLSPSGDYLYLKSGTGITVGTYGIISNTTTTITLDIAPGTNATADKVFQITRGHNLAPGPNMNGRGCGSISGNATTNYIDIGAAQRRMGFPKKVN